MVRLSTASCIDKGQVLVGAGAGVGWFGRRQPRPLSCQHPTGLVNAFKR